MAYVIAFGDFITVKQLGMDAAREDELVDYNTNRTNVVCGLRNLFLGLLTPFPPLGGPMSAPYAVSTFQRYKNSGREGMDSIWDGYGTNMILAVIGLFCYPLYLVALVGSGAVLAVLVMIQGYVCTQIAVSLAGDKTDLGIAGMMSGVMVAKGGAWGIGSGSFVFPLCGPEKIRKDYQFNLQNRKKRMRCCNDWIRGNQGSGSDRLCGSACMSAYFWERWGPRYKIEPFTGDEQRKPRSQLGDEVQDGIR